MNRIHRIRSRFWLAAIGLTLSAAPVYAHGDETHDAKEPEPAEAPGHSHERAKLHGGQSSEAPRETERGYL